MSPPFLVIAGATSGSGKTTLTAGIIAALRRRGLRVQPFKVGPDYIDPTYHRLAAGRPCRNFDSWMVEPATAVEMAYRAAADADVAVVEGVMGLYDGASYDEEVGSTAHAAKLLGAPVVLVLDVGRVARSAAALALGFQQFDRALPLAGYIANRCGSSSHAEGVRRAIEQATGLPLFGWLPKEEEITLPSRHLGLVPLDEDPALRGAIERVAELVEHHLDLDALLALAGESTDRASPTLDPIPPTRSREEGAVGIAVARDVAFSFYYEDNLDLLRAAGAEILPFSPLEGERLPAGTSGLYLGGGFPELYAHRLSENRAMQGAIREAVAAGMPLYAECGGFMYLTEGIIDIEGVRHPMIGLVPGTVTMQRRRVRLGYCEVRGEHWLLAGAGARGHEFHWSSWDGDGGAAPAFVVEPRRGGERRPAGYCRENLVASYVHLHFASQPELAGNFVTACHRFRQEREEVG